MARPARFLVAIPILAVLFGLTIWTFKLGESETLAYDVTEQLASWQGPGKSPSIEAWLHARDELRSAQRMSRKNGAVEELLGLVHAQRRNNADFQQIALEHFTAALALRSSSPYTWASIADVRYRLGATTHDFERVLTIAADLGPNEPEVQRVVVDLGFALWDEMSPPTRTAVLRSLKLGMQRNPLEMLKISERRGRLPLACPEVPSAARSPDPQWAKLCESKT